MKIELGKSSGFWKMVWSNDSLPKYYKQMPYFEFIKTSDARYFKYKDSKPLAIKLLKEGKKTKEISELLLIKESTIWTWKYRELNNEIK